MKVVKAFYLFKSYKKKGKNLRTLNRLAAQEERIVLRQTKTLSSFYKMSIRTEALTI